MVKFQHKGHKLMSDREKLYRNFPQIPITYAGEGDFIVFMKSSFRK